MTAVASPSRVKDMMKVAFRLKKPMMIWGPPGIGKSDIVFSMGLLEDRPVIDMRLLLLDPTDLKGIPYFDDESKTMKWAAPSDLPANISEEEIALIREQVNVAAIELENARAAEAAGSSKNTATLANAKLAVAEMANELNKITRKMSMLVALAKMGRAILFLDEINAAAPSIQAAAYQLILNRKIGSYTLPDGVVVICAGNRAGDRGVTYNMPAPLANRLTHVEMEANANDWLEWAIDAKIHPYVIAHISNATDQLFVVDRKSTDHAFRTPRSWATVSDYLYDQEKHGYTSDITNDLIRGAISTVGENSFRTFTDLAAHIPTTTEILEKGGTLTLNKSGKLKESATRSAQFFVSTNCSVEIAAIKNAVVNNGGKYGDVTYTDEQLNKMLNNFIEFITKNMGDEMQVMVVRNLLRSYKVSVTPNKVPAISVFVSKFKEYLVDQR